MDKEERSFGQVFLTAIKKLVLKLISFKNLIAMGSIVLGVIVAFNVGVTTSFKEWDSFMFKVLVLFFATNQVQKWIFAKYKLPDDRDKDLYEDSSVCEDEDNDE